MDQQSAQNELAELRKRVEELESFLRQEKEHKPFEPSGYYTAYYATTGAMLGLFAGAASLLFSIVGSVLFGKRALELIRVYLTFPFGDDSMKGMNEPLVLALGCCLYLGTGMILGIVFYLFLTRFTAQSTFFARLVVASVLAVVIWLVNYYAILSWLQPMLVKNISQENLIVNAIPWWVALSTHLVFGWAMVLLYPLGQYTPYRLLTDDKNG